MVLFLVYVVFFCICMMNYYEFSDLNYKVEIKVLFMRFVIWSLGFRVRFFRELVEFSFLRLIF